MTTTPVRLALSAFLVLTGAVAATLPVTPAHRTVVQAEPACEAPCTVLPHRDAATQRLADEMTVEWNKLKVEVAP